MSEEKVLQLQKDMRVSWREYGDPNGVPVVFCHGWPSSSTMAELTDAAAREVGARIISPDRPGICGSSFQRNRKLLDWPPILERIVDHLGIAEFRVLAMSGGAPYAYAAAWALPERVKAIAIASGAPPITELDDQDGLLPLYRWMLALHHAQPWLLRFCFHAARPVLVMRASVRAARRLVRLLQPCDAESLRNSAAFDACFESQRRAWRGSARGIIQDAQIHAEPWGFPLEDIRAPVRLWHGRQDRSFSFRIAEEVAARLPNCKTRIIENAGHYSLPIRQMRDILADLIEA